MKYPRNLAPILFAIAITAAFGALLIGNNLGALKPVFAQAPTPTPERKIFFPSQDNPSVEAADDESYTFLISEEDAVYGAEVGTVPTVMNTFNSQDQRHISMIGADRNRFAIASPSGRITMGTLPVGVYHVTVIARIVNYNGVPVEGAVHDQIDVRIIIGTQRPTPTASTTIVFVSQDDPSLPAAHYESYSFNTSETAASASVGTIPSAILWNAESNHRAYYQIESGQDHGADHDKFSIDNESGEITIAAGQTTLSDDTYNITLRGRVWNTSSPANFVSGVIEDRIDVEIVVRTPTIFFTSQDNPGVKAADDESYTFIIPDSNVVADATVGTVPTVLNTFNSQHYKWIAKGQIDGLGYGSDHDKFGIASPSGRITMGNPLPLGIYNITLIARVTNVNGDIVEGSVSDRIDVKIIVGTPRPTPTASTTIVFASQDDPSLGAADFESYAFTMSNSSAAVANASIGTIPSAILWNADTSKQRSHYSIDSGQDHGADHDKFSIDNESGEITIAASQTTLPGGTYNITLRGRIWTTEDGGRLDGSHVDDHIDVKIIVGIPTFVFASQDNPGVAAANNAGYSFTMSESAAVANALVGTIPPAILRNVNAASNQRAKYRIGTHLVSGHGADYDKFRIGHESGKITIAGSQSTLPEKVYKITLIGEVVDANNRKVSNSIADRIRVEIVVGMPPPTPTPLPTASTTLVFASQNNPSVVAADDESYAFTISEDAAVASASVGTIPSAIIWNSDSTLRANYKIGTDTSSGHGVDHDKFHIDARSGEITIAAGQSALSENTYNITLIGEVYHKLSNGLYPDTFSDEIDVEITVTPPPTPTPTPAPAVQFTSQGEHGGDANIATDDESYAFAVAEGGAVASASVGTIPSAVLWNTGAGYRANYRIGAESGHGVDHDKFAIDAVSGAITIAASQSTLPVNTYNITLIGEIVDTNNGNILGGSVNDEIDVEIVVGTPPPTPTPTPVASTTLIFVSEYDHSVAAADGESYSFTVLPSAAVASAPVGTIPPAILENEEAGHRARYRIAMNTSFGHGPDHDKFDIHSRSGEITIAASQATLSLGVYKITLLGDVVDANNLDVANTIDDFIEVEITVGIPPPVASTTLIFVSQDDPSVAAADDESYAFAVIEDSAVASAPVGTIPPAILENVRSSIISIARAGYRIGRESGHGADHDKFDIDDESGAITIAASQSTLPVNTYNITLIGSIINPNNGALWGGTVEDEIDVEIQVLAWVEEIEIASQDDPDTAAEDDEIYSYHTFLDTDVIGTIATIPTAAVVNLSASKAVFVIRDTADAVNFAISRLGEIRIAVEDLATGVYDIIVDVSLRDNADGAYRSPDSVDVNITALHPPSKAVFSEGAPTSGIVGAPAAPPTESTEAVDGRAAEVVDLSAYVDNAGRHDVTYGVTLADGTATDLFEISEDGVLSSTDALLFHDDDDRDTYKLTITLADNNLGGTDPDELDFTVTVMQLLARFDASAPTEATVEVVSIAFDVDAEPVDIVDFGAHVSIPVATPGTPATKDDPAVPAVLHEVSFGVSDTVNFAISEDGVLSSTEALRFYDDPAQDTHELTITLTDETVGVTHEHEITVTVEEVPPGTQAEFDVLETQVAGDIDGVLIRIEVNGEIVEDGYRMNADLSGDASEVFAVADDGQISVLQEAIDANVLDLDAGGNPNRYILTIEADGGTTLGVVAINVKEVDEPPVFDDPALTVTVHESNTAEFGSPYIATDPEGTTVTFTIKEPEAGTADLPFVISPDGQLSVASDQSLILDVDDIDNSSEYLMTIVATDATGVQTELAITVLITNYDPFIDFTSSLTPGTDESTNDNPQSIDFTSSLTTE